MHDGDAEPGAYFMRNRLHDKDSLRRFPLWWNVALS